MHILGQVIPGYGQAPIVFEERVLDHSGLPELLPLRTGDTESPVPASGCRQAHMDHAIWSLIGIRVHEDGVNHTEDCRCGANAECKRKHGGQRKARHLDQLPESVADILK